MIDVDGIRELLKQCNLYDKENSKNFICKCPYCGDKKSTGNHKHSHCYVSKLDNTPVAHCFFCNGSWSLQKLLKDISGSERKDLIIPVNNKNYVKKNTSKQKVFKLPELDCLSFPLKSLYMRRRTFNKLEVSSDIQNLIFDIEQFFDLNNLNIFDYLNGWEKEFAQNNMVGFLSKRNSILYLRSVSNDVPMKFKKVILQKDLDLPGLDYYCIDNYKLNSNLIVLSEGNFDILGCYSLDTLDLRSKCRAYCAGCTFSYEQLFKSVCIDFGMYRPNVIILSDSDKQKYHYKNFLQNIKDYVESIEIYYNSCGKDFGDYPNKPVRVF